MISRSRAGMSRPCSAPAAGASSSLSSTASGRRAGQL
nr:MAG TPA: hypothetical protein [Caudoviricetes sp.]